jgi:hypothetical protein
MVCGAVWRDLCVVTAHDNTTVKVQDPKEAKEKWSAFK